MLVIWGGKNDISIHALLTEGDLSFQIQRYYQQISIHALLTEGDWAAPLSPAPSTNFNPRPPHGGRPGRFSLR